jgi:hypothetical protein
MPAGLKRKLGLDSAPSWIVTVEINQFDWPGPDLRPTTPESGTFVFGALPSPLLRRILIDLKEHLRAGRLRTTRRTQ